MSKSVVELLRHLIAFKIKSPSADRMPCCGIMLMSHLLISPTQTCRLQWRLQDWQAKSQSSAAETSSFVLMLAWRMPANRLDSALSLRVNTVALAQWKPHPVFHNVFSVWLAQFIKLCQMVSCNFKPYSLSLSAMVWTQGPYDVVLLPGGMPGAQNLAEVRNTQINSM